MGWLLKKSSYEKLYQSDDLDKTMVVLKTLLDGNSIMKKGESITIEVTDSQWDEEGQNGNGNT